ncbi:MAG: ABC transporter ATP-binding protein [Nitrososphaerales archaeon]
MAELLSVEDLKIRFLGQTSNAVDGVSFSVKEAEILGLVGESGAGKSITGRSILRLLPPNGRIVSGRILFKGVDLLTLSDEEMRKIRGKEITAIQQDPLSSLNPAFRIRDQMVDILKIHLGMGKSEAEEYSVKMLQEVGIPNPELVLRKFPHQLSGGMCQRVMIAIAFSCNPTLVIADEPTTALDVITQALVVNLMKRMKEKLNTSIIFITHNLALASNICDRIAVMKMGKIVEMKPTKELFRTPEHPYTLTLLEAVPKVGRRVTRIPEEKRSWQAS